MFGRGFVPDYNRADKFVLRGRIKKHLQQQSGFWIFKRITPGVLIELNAADYEKFKAAAVDFQTLNGPIPGPVPREIPVHDSSLLAEKWPLGSEVDLTIAYSDQILQEFFRNEAITTWDLSMVPKAEQSEAAG